MAHAALPQSGHPDVDNTTPVDDFDLDGLILSGGAARVGLTGELGNCGAYLELDIPFSAFAPAIRSWRVTVATPANRRAGIWRHGN